MSIKPVSPQRRTAVEKEPTIKGHQKCTLQMNAILTIVIPMEIDHGSVPSSPRHDYCWSRRLDFWVVKLGNEILIHQDLTGGPWSKLNLLPVWRLLIFIYRLRIHLLEGKTRSHFKLSSNTTSLFSKKIWSDTTSYTRTWMWAYITKSVRELVQDQKS